MKTAHMVAVKKLIYLIIFASFVMGLLMMTSCGDKKADIQPSEQSRETTVTDVTETIGSSDSKDSHESSNNTGDIGISKAKAIALAKVPGAGQADIVEIEREEDDGRIEYEGHIYYNGYEYEFEIDGTTGNILQWEIDD